MCTSYTRSTEILNDIKICNFHVIYELVLSKSMHFNKIPINWPWVIFKSELIYKIHANEYSTMRMFKFDNRTVSQLL
jgi:hypothetical protein